MRTFESDQLTTKTLSSSCAPCSIASSCTMATTTTTPCISLLDVQAAADRIKGVYQRNTFVSVRWACRYRSKRKIHSATFGAKNPQRSLPLYECLQISPVVILLVDIAIPDICSKPVLAIWCKTTYFKKPMFASLVDGSALNKFEHGICGHPLQALCRRPPC